MNTLVSFLKGRSAVATVFACVTVAGSLAAHGQAITGSISFTGGGADLNLPMGSATAYTGFFGIGTNTSPVVQASSQTGSYSSVPSLTPVTFSTFSFMPFSGPQLLWSFTTGGETYSFTATSIAMVNQMGSPGNFLNIQGSGFASITGTVNYTDTLATWTYTDTGSGTAVNFAGSITATPEPSTISLMAVPVLLGWAIRLAARRKTAC